MGGADDEGALRERLQELFKSTPCMPLMVRLAWHDAGTYNAENKTGGVNGSIRFKKEVGHGCNAGLDKGLSLLTPIKDDFPDVSWADLLQLASVVAIEFAGGPKIPFEFGRHDATEDLCTEEGRLPDGNHRLDKLRDVFYRMGFSDKDIVVLSGAHALGRAHPERSGFDGKWTHDPLKFDNKYYVNIVQQSDPELLRLPSDLSLLDTKGTAELVRRYAADQDAFFSDYVPSHVKLSELGFRQHP